MTLLASMEWIVAGVGFLLGAIAGYGLKLQRERVACRRAADRAREEVQLARREAETMRQEAQRSAAETADRLRGEAEAAAARRQAEIDAVAERVAQREALLNRHLEGMVAQEQSLREQQQELGRRQEQLALQAQATEALQKQRRAELQRIAGLDESAARNQLLREVEVEAEKDASDLSRHVLEAARANAEREARRIVSMAVQRYAGTQTYDLTTASVSLNGASDIKGRIIGRDGRNIRAFETATGVTVLIDDTPNTVVLSGFDPVRREVARRSMEVLVADGRIHPTRIEEVVQQANQEVEEAIREAGEEAVHEVGLPPLHHEIVMLLGRLRFRQSYSQNILHHSVEVAQLAGLMAAELKANVVTARRAGLLHDIGKAINHEIEGSHALIGAEFLKRHGESEEVVNAVAAHHDEVSPAGIVAVLVSAADALSAARPGARSESMTNYLRRLEGLEQIGASFAGVERCYAVQAGRELRVIVQPEALKDEEAAGLARRIARKIEGELQYPGQIRVTVVRETRCVEFAK